MRTRPTPTTSAAMARGIDAVAVFVNSVAPVERFEVELRPADQEVVGDHNAGNRTEQAGIADQPAEDVVVEARQQFPRHHRQAEKAGDQPARAERDQLRIEVGNIVRRRDDIRRDIDVQRRHQQRDHRDEGDHWLMKAPHQIDRVPDRLAEDHCRRRRHRHADERIQRHRDGQSKGLAHDLRVLRFRVAREVGNVQRQRRPVAHHRGERREEEAQKRTGRMELARLRQHRTEATRLYRANTSNSKRHHQHERRRKSLQEPDALHAPPHHRHVERPEPQEARPHRPRSRCHSRPHHNQHCVNRLPADPRLNPEPPAGHNRAQNRRHIRAAHAKRRAHKHRKRNPVLRAGMRIQQQRNQHDQIAQQNRADRLLPVHPARDQPRGKHVGAHLHRHREPQRDVVVRAPRAMREPWSARGPRCRGSIVPPPSSAIAMRLRAPRAADNSPRPALPRYLPFSTISSPRE